LIIKRIQFKQKSITLASFQEIGMIAIGILGIIILPETLALTVIIMGNGFTGPTGFTFYPEMII